MTIYRLTITRKGYYRDKVKYVQARHLNLTLTCNKHNDVKVERAEVGDFEVVKTVPAGKTR